MLFGIWLWGLSMNFDIQPFLDWPLWGKVSVIAATVGSLLTIVHYLLGFVRRPRDEAHARRVVEHLLKTGPIRRPYATYKAKLRGTPEAQITSLLLECGAKSSPNKFTRREMWGLPSRANQ